MDKYNSRPSSSAGHLKRNAELADLNQKSSDSGNVHLDVHAQLF